MYFCFEKYVVHTFPVWRSTFAPLLFPSLSAKIREQSAKLRAKKDESLLWWNTCYIIFVDIHNSKEKRIGQFRSRWPGNLWQSEIVHLSVFLFPQDLLSLKIIGLYIFLVSKRQVQERQKSSLKMSKRRRPCFRQALMMAVFFSLNRLVISYVWVTNHYLVVPLFFLKYDFDPFLQICTRRLSLWQTIANKWCKSCNVFRNASYNVQFM